MANTKIIRKRIKAIGNTAKITGAMEMVAASKMKKAQDAALHNREYALSAFKILCSLNQDNQVKHFLLNQNNNAAKTLLVVITSDKGLCGSYNAATIRKALEFIKQNPDCEIITVGKKGQQLLQALKYNIILTYTDLPVEPKERDILPIIQNIISDYKIKKYKTVMVCFTDFQSTLKQIPNLKQLIPFVPDEGEICEIKSSEFKFEPTTKEVVNQIVPRILETQFFQMILESIASEQSARMIAMKNATDSAQDLIEDLTLTYNSIRQGSITQELTEISAAVNSTKEF